MCSQLRNSPTELPVERGRDRANERVVGEIVDDVLGHPDRKAPLDVALVSVDQEHGAAAPLGKLARVPWVTDVRDQLLVDELREFVAGTGLKGHSGRSAGARVGDEAKLMHRTATSRWCPSGTPQPARLAPHDH
ncbi:MAG: hypothetical protein ACLP50_33825 [Solirubrobacteraceae bacterium]